MTDYDRELRGALYRNDRKRPDKKDPDYNGKATIDGVEYWVDSWINTQDNGSKYMSLKFKPKTQKPIATQVEDAGGALNDDIPFAPCEAGSVA